MNKRSTIITQPGDIWLLGRHRLMCGDSTKKEQVTLLMDGEKGDMAFTDPPYNSNYQGRKGHYRQPIKNDHLSKTAYVTMINQFLSAQQAILKRDSSFYLFCSGAYYSEFQQVLEAHDYEIRNQIVWAKNHFVLSFARYKLKHELLLYCHHKKEKDPWYGDNKQNTLWEFPKPTANKLHPTMKPVALIEKALLNSSKKNDIIVDLFAGAGSTLIACEKLERSARLMEIEPAYVDIIIWRWQAYTQQTAVLAKNGLSFSAGLQRKKKS
jgi:DNA modification methylase